MVSAWGTVSELGKPVLTFYDGGAPIREGLMEKELDYPRRFWLNWLEIRIRMRQSKGTSSSLTRNVSFNLFRIVDEDRSFFLASAILSETESFDEERSGWCST